MRKMSKTDKAIAGVLTIWVAMVIGLLFVAFSLKADNDELRAEVAVLYGRVDYLADTMTEYQGLSNSIDENILDVVGNHDVELRILRERVEYVEGQADVLRKRMED